MNHYLIDGYNLLFFLKLDHSSLEEERNLLIQAILLHIKELPFFFTLVFDAHLQISDLSRRHIENLEIIFTEEKKTADEWIIEEISRKKANQFIVASNDRRLCSLARSEGAKTISIQLFIEQLLRFHKRRKIPLKKENKSPLKKIEPIPKKKLAGSLEYYLEVFDKENKDTSPKQENLKKINKKEKILEVSCREEPTEEVSKIKTDFERWLFLFESGE